MADTDRPAAPQPTPGPWYKEEHLEPTRVPSTYWSIWSEAGDCVVSVIENEADADRIVRAANSYIPMLAALRAARAEFDHVFGNFDFEAWSKSWGNGRQHPAKQVLDMIDAAIAAAQQDGGAV